MKGLNSSLAIVGSLGLSSVCVCVCTHALVGGPVPHCMSVCACRTILVLFLKSRVKLWREECDEKVEYVYRKCIRHDIPPLQESHTDGIHHHKCHDEYPTWYFIRHKVIKKLLVALHNQKSRKMAEEAGISTLSIKAI